MMALTRTPGGRNYRPSISRGRSMGIITILVRFVTIADIPSFALPAGASFERKREVPQSSAVRPSAGTSINFACASTCPERNPTGMNGMGAVYGAIKGAYD